MIKQFKECDYLPVYNNIIISGYEYRDLTSNVTGGHWYLQSSHVKLGCLQGDCWSATYGAAFQS